MRKLIIPCLVGLMLSGCTYVDRLTGQTDNTVLPGAREDAVPGHPKYPDATQPASADPGEPVPKSETTTQGGCPENDPNCGATSGDVFKDPQ
ncbi:MAG: hypothetical protein U1F47_03495 [Hyphomicrobiales bacterium]